MINENRYNALCIYKNVLIELGILTKPHLTGEQKELTPEQKELKEKALMSAALIVLMPSVTGYLAEEHEGGSAAEKLVKLEEFTHDFSRENPDLRACLTRTVIAVQQGDSLATSVSFIHRLHNKYRARAAGGTHTRSVYIGIIGVICG